jgi:carbamoylphosphate synthase large subunit
LGTPYLKRVLFSKKDDWVEPVRERLDSARFSHTFQNLAEADVSAFDCIVPLYLKDYVALRSKEYRANFLIPSRTAVDVTDDKSRFNAWLGSVGYGDLVPEFLDGDDAYPFIYKKRHDRAGRNSYIIHSPEEQHAIEKAIDVDEFFKQRYVPGRKEYTSHFLMAGGKIVFHTTVEFTFRDDFYVRGIREPRNTINKVMTPFVPVFSGILEALDYKGTCCFNYKIENGKPLVFEINPRAGGSLRLDLNNYLEAYLRALAA